MNFTKMKNTLIAGYLAISLPKEKLYIYVYTDSNTISELPKHTFVVLKFKTLDIKLTGLFEDLKI